MKKWLFKIVVLIGLGLVLWSIYWASVFVVTFIDPFARNHLSDEQLALDLSVNRPLFEKLVEQFEPNPKLEVVHPHWLKPKGALMDEEWNWYQIKFKQLRLDAGIRRYKSNQIWLISTARGLSIGGSSKGYVFNPPDHGKYYQNLDSRPPDLKEAEIGYKRLDSDWAVGYRWSD